MQKIKLLVLLVLSTLKIYSQTGTLSGTVYDNSNSESLIGANIFLINSKIGSISDFDGKYLIKNIPTGTYDFRFSLMGYKEMIITNVEIKENITSILNVKLEALTYETDEVLVTAKAFQNTENSILLSRKNGGTINDGISAEQIKKTTDATSGDALKRVTGLLLIDNKFVFIRGVSDRYNQTTLNGATIASTSSDKKSFSFDMLPANLIDYSNVAKTATPDLPGDFSGGLVQLNTIDFPESKIFKSSYGSAFNSYSSQKMMNLSNQNSSDWRAIDNGGRDFPEGNNILEVQSKLKNSWAPKQTVAPLNQSFSLSYGDKYSFDESILGVISSLSYRNNFDKSHFNLTDFEGNVKLRDFAGDIDRFSALWSGLVDFNYQINSDNKISFRNNFSASGEDKVTLKSGYHQTDGERKDYSIEWNERKIVSSQIGGKHNLDLSEIQWQLNNSNSISNLKDRRSIEYSRSEGSSTEDPFIAKPGERAWSWMNDNVVGGKVDYKINFGSNNNFEIENLSLKTGLYFDIKKRDYKIRYFQISDRNLSPQNNQFRILPIETIYAEENFGTGKWNLFETSKPSDNYSSDLHLYATYFLSDIEFNLFNKKARFYGGGRFENFNQNVYTTLTPDSPTADTANLNKIDFLPSFNFTFWLNNESNFRIAYSNTVNRPEFREMAKSVFFDNNRFEWLYGNSNLKRALIQNFDLRYEMFPSNNEIIAATFFYKKFTDAIEEEIIITAGDINRTWFNSPNAYNFGWEFEIKKTIQKSFYFNANYTRIFSEVNFIKVGGNSINPIYQNSVRPLQGQSPWMLNFGIGFNHPEKNNSFNISLNSYGRRLDAVLGYGEEDIYEKSRTTIDLTYIQPIYSGIDLKLAIKEIGSPDIILTKGNEIYRKTKKGVTYSMQFSFNILEVSTNFNNN